MQATRRFHSIASSPLDFAGNMLLLLLLLLLLCFAVTPRC